MIKIPNDQVMTWHDMTILQTKDREIFRDEGNNQELNHLH